ncbi:MAG TPA: hypothetical protein VMT50_08870 [Steroidobacteraceae bacterium]|nr:hypothetical protein [Steroidobacteraceae bacterium]
MPIAILAAVAWALTLVLIAVAVAANWQLTKRMSPRLVTAILIAIGVLVLIAFVWNPVWLGVAALVAVFAVWAWFLARRLPGEVTEVHDHFERVAHPERAAEQDAERAESAERGTALEHVLDEAVHEEHPEDLEAIKDDD